MKISISQLPDGLTPHHAAWSELLEHLQREQPDVALLNEMPFGDWLADKAQFQPGLATASVLAHDGAMPALQRMTTAVLSSRPVSGPEKLANEAFLMADGRYQPVHHKHYFPQEPGYYEESWFAPQRPGFDVVELRGLRIGVLLCTELMFTEWARHYRRQGAHVIMVPRASGSSMHYWHAAAAMAAIVSGCYVLSSNRASAQGDADGFGGCGFAFSPSGERLVQTSYEKPFACVDIDLARVAQAQQQYPCYVRELAA